MATLVQMLHLEWPSNKKTYSLTHVVSEITRGAEYTACGIATVDSTLENAGFEAISEYFKGSLKKCTCNDCLKVVNYYKSLK